MHQVFLEVGGLLQSVPPGQLPRCEKQVTRIHVKEKAKKGDISCAGELFTVTQTERTLITVYSWNQDYSRSSNCSFHTKLRYGSFLHFIS